MRPRPGGRHRPRPAGALARGGAAGVVQLTGRGALHRRARGLRRDPVRARRPRARRRRRRALRPRRLLAPARRGRARLRLPRGRTTGHADGRHHWADRRRRPQHLPGARPGPGAQGLRGGEVRPPDRTSRREGPRDRSLQHLGPTGRAPVRRHPGARAAHGRAPRQAHLPGPAHGGQRGAGRASARPAGRHRRHRRGRPRRGGVLPLAGGPAGQARLRRLPSAATSPTTSPSCPQATSRPAGWSPAVPSVPTPPRSTTTRAPPASGCAPSNDSPLPRTEESHKK